MPQPTCTFSPMENSTEYLSSTANHSFSGAGDGNTSEESGWTSYIDYFMETQRRHEETSSAAPSADDVGRRSISQQYTSGDSGLGGPSRLPALIEPSEASRRLSLKKLGRRRRRKKVLYDDALEDTATSPISSPNNKLIELREADANHQKKEDGCDEFPHYKKTTSAAELASCNYLTNSGANTTTDMIDDDGADDNNELRKKGLCLVPVSTLHV